MKPIMALNELKAKLKKAVQDNLDIAIYVLLIVLVITFLFSETID